LALVLAWSAPRQLPITWTKVFVAAAACLAMPQGQRLPISAHAAPFKPQQPVCALSFAKARVCARHMKKLLASSAPQAQASTQQQPPMPSAATPAPWCCPTLVPPAVKMMAPMRSMFSTLCWDQ
jgi:hypothetical protein